MEKYLNYDGLIKLWTKTKNQDTLTLNAAKNHTNESISSAKNELQQKINENSSSITTLNGYFSNGIANKALGDKNGNDITTTYMLANLRGAANGVCPLGSDTKIPSAYLPGYVDDVLEYNSLSNFPATGEAGKIYVAKDTNKTYRWSGTQYTEISASIALGETTGTAYDGGKGKDLADRFKIVEDNYVKSYVETSGSQIQTMVKNDGYLFEASHTDGSETISYIKVSNDIKIKSEDLTSEVTSFTELIVSIQGAFVNSNQIIDSSMAITDAELEALLV